MLALHTWTLDTTPLADALRATKAAGWDGVELRRIDFARAAEKGQPAADVLSLVRASGLPVACVGVELGWMFADGAERQKLMQAFDESCRNRHETNEHAIRLRVPSSPSAAPSACGRPHPS